MALALLCVAGVAVADPTPLTSAIPPVGASASLLGQAWMDQQQCMEPRPLDRMNYAGNAAARAALAAGTLITPHEAFDVRRAAVRSDPIVAVEPAPVFAVVGETGPLHAEFAGGHDEPKRQLSARRSRAASRTLPPRKTSAPSLGSLDSAGYPQWATRALRR